MPKSRLLGFVPFLLPLAFAEWSGAEESLPAVEGDRRPEDRDAIKAHIDQIFRAYMRKDRATIEATHAKEWRGFLGASRSIIRGLDGYMKGADAFLQSPGRIAGYRFEEFDLLFYGDLGLVSYIADVDIATGESPEDSYKTKYRSIDIYAKRDGGWTQVASHLNTHPDILEAQSQEPQPVSKALREESLANREAVWRAYFANDREKLEELLPQDTIAIDAGEEIWHDRGAVLAGAADFAASGAKLVRLEFPRTEIQVYGDTIILYTRYSYELENGGARETYSGRGTEVFVNRRGKLVNVGWHLDSGR
ncbi:MAG TPA: nuclear transport factor 2 family protein [Vicinamibacteria bacterium]